MRMIDLMGVLVGPVISEKSTVCTEKNRQVVFRVRKTATKSQISRAVELLFDVKTESVNVLNVQGKAKRFGKYSGKRSDWKKAYVKLKPGFDVNFTNS